MKAHQKNNEPDKRKKQKRESLKERVHRHINDINSKITDEDIRNVRTELEIRSEAPPTAAGDKDQNKRGKRSSKEQKKENEKDSGIKPSTPWDLLSKGYD